METQRQEAEPVFQVCSGAALYTWRGGRVFLCLHVARRCRVGVPAAFFSPSLSVVRGEFPGKSPRRLSRVPPSVLTVDIFDMRRCCSRSLTDVASRCVGARKEESASSKTQKLALPECSGLFWFFLFSFLEILLIWRHSGAVI